MFPDKCLIVPFILDDTGKSVLRDLRTHHPLSYIIFVIAHRANILLCPLGSPEMDTALGTGELLHLVVVRKGVDGLMAHRALGLFTFGLVKDHGIATVGANSAGKLVRTDINDIAAGVE